MDVGPAGMTSAAYFAAELAALHPVSNINPFPLHMTVEEHQALTVVHDHCVAVSGARPAGAKHPRPSRAGIHGRPLRGADVDGSMLIQETLDEPPNQRPGEGSVERGLWGGAHQFLPIISNHQLLSLFQCLGTGQLVQWVVEDVRLGHPVAFGDGADRLACLCGVLTG
jgi:hypothetical protein